MAAQTGGSTLSSSRGMDKPITMHSHSGKHKGKSYWTQTNPQSTVLSKIKSKGMCTIWLHVWGNQEKTKSRSRADHCWAKDGRRLHALRVTELLYTALCMLLFQIMQSVVYLKWGNKRYSFVIFTYIKKLWQVFFLKMISFHSI